MPATLKLTHKAIGAEVRRGTYDAFFDGKPVGSVEMNDTIEIPVEPGRHTLQVRSGRTRAELRPSMPPRAKWSPSMHRQKVLAALSGVLRRSQPEAGPPPGVVSLSPHLPTDVHRNWLGWATSRS
jgi:hypothetical protein